MLEPSRRRGGLGHPFNLQPQLFPLCPHKVALQQSPAFPQHLSPALQLSMVRACPRHIRLLGRAQELEKRGRNRCPSAAAKVQPDPLGLRDEVRPAVPGVAWAVSLLCANPSRPPRGAQRLSWAAAGQVPAPLASVPELGRKPRSAGTRLGVLPPPDQAPQESPYQSRKWGRN